MPKINVLPKNIAELIAAGEVVERPASVIKELVENAIDAGASSIVVEIKRGGITYMRVTDNGCGIARDQVRTAFLRHATSKVLSADDLNAILTLGFRGEALASVCAVARVEMITAVAGAALGTCYTIHGGEEISLEDAGCSQGTTVIVRDLFYNVPARMKFLKRDVTEGSSVSAIVDRLALSHPEISFRLIRDGKQVLSTAGDGKQRSAIYAVLGREFSAAMLELPPVEGTVKVTGYTCLPTACRPNRNGQFFFMNGRYVKSGTVSAALDQAYKHSAMVGKFPACVLNVSLNPALMDVNVHPTKTEVRFTDERAVFEAVYRTVRAALAAGDRRPEIKLPQKKAASPFSGSEPYRQATVDLGALPLKQPATEMPAAEKMSKPAGDSAAEMAVDQAKPAGTVLTFLDDSKMDGQQLKPGNYRFYGVEAHQPPVQSGGTTRVNLDVAVDDADAVPEELNQPASPPEITAEKPKKPADSAPKPDVEDSLNALRYIGQAFDTYILVSLQQSIYFIDKHAAHERMNFERLKAMHQVTAQLLLAPVAVDLMPEEHAAVLTQREKLSQYGLELEDFGDSAVVVRAVPAELSKQDVSTLVREIAGNILEKNSCESDLSDAILHSIACKAAIRAGDYTSVEEQLSLARRVLSNPALMYCPHGRPIAFKLTKSELEKQFGRLM